MFRSTFSAVLRATRRLRGGALALVMVANTYPGRAETVIRVRLNSDIASSDPGMKRDENTDAVLLHVVEGLVASREDGAIAPMLARSWTLSPDGRVYRFELRRGVYFHNGAPLTAREAAWSLRRYLAPDSHWRCKAEIGPKGFARVAAVSVVGRYAIAVRLDRPAPFFLKTLARADCGGTGIVHPSSVDRSGAWRTPIGTGPFRFGEWRRNEFVDLLRYTRYRPLIGPGDGNGGGKHALVDRVRFQIIPDGSAARAALLRGSLDVLDNLAANEITGLRRVQNIRIVTTPTVDLYALLFQTTDPLLSDRRLRRAIALAIDVTTLTRAATHGTATSNSSPVPAASPYHRRIERISIQRDLDAARRLVHATGYRGQPISLVTNRRYPQAFDAAIIIQAMALDAGIHFQIVTLDWATQLARYARGDYQAMVFGYSARLDPALTLDSLIGDKLVDPRKIWNRPAARRILRRAVDSDVPNVRQSAFDALDEGFRFDAPGVILFNTARITALGPRVVGYRGWPAGLPRLWNVSLKGGR